MSVYYNTPSVHVNRNNFEMRVNTRNNDYFNHYDKIPVSEILVTPTGMSDYTDEEDFSYEYPSFQYSDFNSYSNYHFNYSPYHQTYFSSPQISAPITPLVKCRQLPCRTWISTGSCPYNDRCVFLHDPRVVSKPVPIKTRRKSQEDICQDSCFWPTMPKESVIGLLDEKNLPHINQKYIVPNPSSLLVKETKIFDFTDSTSRSLRSSDSFTSTHCDTILIGSGYDPTKDYRHVEAVYSMWSHFLDFCATDINSIVTEPRLVAPIDPTNPFNAHTGRKRLEVFQALSLGNSFKSRKD